MCSKLSVALDFLELRRVEVPYTCKLFNLVLKYMLSLKGGGGDSKSVSLYCCIHMQECQCRYIEIVRIMIICIFLISETFNKIDVDIND